MALGKATHSFSMMPGDKGALPFYLTAHTTGGPHKRPTDGYYTAHTTVAQDGTSVMDDAGLVNFLARGLLLWTYDVMEQLPPRLRVEINKTEYLRAFKFYNEQGEETSLEPWPMAPAPEVNVRYEARHIDAQVSVLDTLYGRMAGAIPGVAPSPFASEYLSTRSRKIRPSCEYFICIKSERQFANGKVQRSNYQLNVLTRYRPTTSLGPNRWHNDPSAANACTRPLLMMNTRQVTMKFRLASNA